MTAVSMSDALERVRPAGAIGAFNVIQLEHAEAIVAGAEAAGRPVVLQLSENTAAYHRGLAPIALACRRLADDAATEVVVHLDHATSAELVHEAVALGLRSVMYDASALPHADNIAATEAVAAWCHDRGVWVEAELGEIGGKDGAHAPGARTDPVEATAYVEATGVDALAVAVGSSHAMLTRDAVLDEELIARLAKAIGVPLVLHGSSGVPDDGLAQAVARGMAKVNIATQLNKVMTSAVRDALARDASLVDPRKYLGPGREAIATEAERLLRLLAP
ncbi:MAG: class II fructose-bisphosphate aldolase [Nocardioidaceae bacterium]